MSQVNCRDIPLQAYLDRDPEVDLKRVEAHLEECADCRRQADFWRELKGKVGAAEREQAVPQGFQQRLRAHLDKVESASVTPVTLRRPWHRWALGAGVAACLMLASLPLLKSPADPVVGLVSDMVNHHQVCWDIPASAGRRQHFERWVQAHPGKAIPVPLLASASLHEEERRDCPVGEGAHGPHLMLKRSDGSRVSLYSLPQADLKGVPAVPQEPQAHHYQGYAVVVWQRGGWTFGLVAQGSDSEVLSWIDPALALSDPAAVAAALLPTLL